MESGGGQIVAESAGEGRGSTFILSLPLEIAYEEADCEQPESPIVTSPCIKSEHFTGDVVDQDVRDKEMSMRYNTIEEQHNLLIGDADEES